MHLQNLHTIITFIAFFKYHKSPLIDLLNNVNIAAFDTESRLPIAKFALKNPTYCQNHKNLPNLSWLGLNLHNTKIQQTHQLIVSNHPQ